ncbi:MULTISPECIES: ribonuclease HII [Corynebacterium]|uniref:ribonuclease HII n=2 Tax=Bacteria TaxID=2 RepID=UPI001EF4A4AE|nr:MULTISPECIES: ribonuclease HII [Corynebacterium]MCG7233956.1 ribonuclease HII [Corynebacterium sp. ACRPR]MCG7243411.1 ribonuclease HII [Corynebacterium sp. ACRPS]MCG7271518.1 ribonuclease HII [Corynebacterium sp. ACRQM]MDK8473736.1 ribonuclease HII [Corynebacterium sp. MSK078]MDK8658154.1 ribonuclease HII [Corynebacterium sp. MSK204]
MSRMRRLKQQRTFEVALARAGLGPVAGVDEAGRGACCGPVTVAACILPERIVSELDTLTDSKKLTPRQREKLFPIIKDKAVDWSVVHIGAGDIDKRGIQHANTSGMRRAIARLEQRPGYVLSDALFIPGLTQPHLPIIGGDAAARCIAAASVLAKVSRDRLMRDLDERFPGYGLAGHKGYGTKAHEAAIAALGASPEHRMSYSNVQRAHAHFTARA